MPEKEDWQPHLLKPRTIELLINSNPWEVLAKPMPGLDFPDRPWFRALKGRLDSYCRDHGQALWEATHHFPITPSMRKDAWIGHYFHARKRRRSKAGAAWAAICDFVVDGIQIGECDLDVFLFPAELHLPIRRVESPGITADSGEWYPGHGHPTPIGSLRDALDFADRQDPWRNQYRLSPMDHPALQISRLRVKYGP